MRRKSTRIKGKNTEPFKLGDAVESALSSIGITKERVEKWLGRPCRCRERKRKLNQISSWVSGIMGGDKSKAKEEFDKIIGDEGTGSSS